MGRAPNLTELGIFSAMWNEHCSYKSSRVWLRKLPTEAPWVICGPGENAGVVDIGDGQAAVFKMESHNHPSFIEPYQGAATGVGGILRDVFTMGARPVASLDALRFGAPGHPKTRHLVAGVVAGIGGYGNCIGVPTVGGSCAFDAAYDGNILVNAMTVGVAPADRIFYAAAENAVGNPVVYVGAKTGRDGIHGATMASAAFDEGTEEKRPTVQVGDPFTEKLLMEACLALMAIGRDHRDPGHGRGGAHLLLGRDGGQGRRRDRARPRQGAGARERHDALRDHAVGEPGAHAHGDPPGGGGRREGGLREVGRRLRRHRPGDGDRPLRAQGRRRRGGRPAGAPAGGRGAHLRAALRAHAEAGAAGACAGRRGVRARADGGAANAARRARSLLQALDLGAVRPHGDGGHGAAAGRRCRRGAGPRHEQGARAHRRLHAPLLRRRPGLGRGAGGGGGLAQPHRQWARPLAITDCLNFGNPERPQVMGQFAGCIEGMAEACRALDFPVVSGNVSFYNETEGAGILPTPSIGGLGLIADLERMCDPALKAPGEALLLVGGDGGHLARSLYQREIEGREEGPPPAVDLAAERRHGDFVRRQIEAGMVSACHDISDGGLLVALAEMALAALDAGRTVGARIAVPAGVPSAAGWLFGEDQARYLVSAPQHRMPRRSQRRRRARACRSPPSGPPAGPR